MSNLVSYKNGIFCTFDPYIGGSNNGKDQQKQDEEECFQTVGSNSLYTKEYGSQ